MLSRWLSFCSYDVSSVLETDFCAYVFETDFCAYLGIGIDLLWLFGTDFMTATLNFEALFV